MNIEKWNIKKIMQLPDWCFGQRWPVCVSNSTGLGVTKWDISEVAFPNVGVIWEVLLPTYYMTLADDWFRLALGQQVPKNTAMMDKLDPLIMGLGRQGAEPRKIGGFSYHSMSIRKMRKVMEFQGRKLVLETKSSADKVLYINVVVIVSSIPKEVPDWLFSGRAAILS